MLKQDARTLDTELNLQTNSFKENIFEQVYTWFFDYQVKCTSKDCIETDSSCGGFYSYKGKSEWAGYTKEFQEARNSIMNNNKHLSCGAVRKVNIPKVIAAGAVGIAAVGAIVHFSKK